MNRLNFAFKFTIIGVEYPGYGIYPETPTSPKTAAQIILDAETVFKFITDTLHVNKNKIIVSGRSIGSGPACHLAANFDPRCLMLTSPIKSVNNIARKICGRITDLVI